MVMQQNSSASFSSSTVDPAEVAKFSKLSDEWWDPKGKMAPLHKINPLRLTYIRDAACRKFERNAKSLNCLSGLRMLDIGCGAGDRKSTRLNSSHGYISYAVFCLKKKKEDLCLRHIDSTFVPP